MSRSAHVFAALRKTPGLIVLLLLSMLLGLAYSFVVPFISMFGTREVGMSHFTFGLFMTVTSLSAVVISTFLARFSDTRWSRRAVLLLSGGCGGLGYLGYAFVRDPLLLTLIGSILLGISSISFGQVFAHARDVLERSSIERHEIPFFMNFVRLFFALAWTVGPALAAYLMTRYSYRVTFCAAALTYALFAAVVFFSVPNLQPSEESRKAAEETPLGSAFKDPALLAHFCAFVLYFSCSTMGMMNLPLLILGELGGSERDVGIAYSVAPIFELPFMYYVGVLATRIEHRRLISFALLLAVVYYAGLTLATTPLHVFFLQTLSAGIVAVMSGVAITFFQNFLPNQSGSATNLYASASRIGSTVGYLAFGAIGGTLGHRVVFGLTVGLCVIASGILMVSRGRTERLAR